MEMLKVTGVYIKAKREVNEQFVSTMNQDVNGNMKLFWKDVSKAKGEKVESCSRIKDINGRSALGKYEEQKIWEDYFEVLFNIYTKELVAVHMYSFDGVRRANYVGREPIRRTEVEVRVGKLKNEKDEVTGEMIKGGDDRVVDWILSLCNMAFESGVGTEVC